MPLVKEPINLDQWLCVCAMLMGTFRAQSPSRERCWLSLWHGKCSISGPSAVPAKKGLGVCSIEAQESPSSIQQLILDVNMEQSFIPSPADQPTRPTRLGSPPKASMLPGLRL